MIYSNFHTHSNFSDGSDEMKLYCQKALELGFHSLGFSDHAPVRFNNSFSINPDRLSEYFESIDSLKTEFQGRLNIFTSIEADFIPNHSFDYSFFRQQAALDYLIGSIHLVLNEKNNRMWFIDGSDPLVWDKGVADIFDGDIKKGVVTFYEQTMNMIETQKPDVVGHLDKIKMHNKDRHFLTTDKWYTDLIAATLKLIKDHNMVLEVNSRGIYKGRCKELFPSPQIALQAQKMGIPIVLNSDAHQPQELNGGYEIALETLKKHGIAELVEFTKSGWKNRSL